MSEYLEEALPLSKQETCSEDTDEEEYRKSLCLLPKEPRGNLLRQRSLSFHGDYTSVNNKPTSEQSQHNYNNDLNFCAVSEYYYKSSKVTAENDDCTQLQKEQILGDGKYKVVKKYEDKKVVDIPDISTVDHEIDEIPHQNVRIPKNKKLHPEENSLEEGYERQYGDKQIQEHKDPSLLNNNNKLVPLENCIPESLEEQLDVHKAQVQIDEIPKHLIDEIENQLEELVPKSEEEEIRHDNIDSGDCIKMNGLFGRFIYKHCAVVESKCEDSVEVVEYTLRALSYPLLSILTMIMTLACLDPIAMLAEAKTSTYTMKRLAERHARKLNFPEKLIKNINSDLTQKSIQRRLNEPCFLYSLQWNNCEHLVFKSLFGISKSFQVAKSKVYLCAMDVIYAVGAAIHLYVTGLIASHLGISWVSTCIIHEVYLALYQSQKVYRLNKHGYLATTEFKKEMCSIWTRAFITLPFALFAGWKTGPVVPFWRSTSIIILLGNLIGVALNQKFIVIDSRLHRKVLTWSWVAVGVCYAWYMCPCATLIN